MKMPAMMSSYHLSPYKVILLTVFPILHFYPHDLFYFMFWYFLLTYNFVSVSIAIWWFSTLPNAHSKSEVMSIFLNTGFEEILEINQFKPLILQMRKIKPREITQSVQGCSAILSQTRDENLAFLLPSPVIILLYTLYAIKRLNIIVSFRTWDSFCFVPTPRVSSWSLNLILLFNH